MMMMLMIYFYVSACVTCH